MSKRYLGDRLLGGLQHATLFDKTGIYLQSTLLNVPLLQNIVVVISGYENYPALKKNIQQHNGKCVSADRLRDCEYTIDFGDRIFAPGMNRLLLRALIIHRWR